MTIRQYIVRRVLTFSLGLIAFSVIGITAVQFLEPGTCSMAVVLVTLLVGSLFIFDRAVSLRCPQCGKPIGLIVVRVAIGVANQRCPHCRTGVDEPIKPDGAK